MDRYSTHEVDNQVEPLADYSLFETDVALQEAIAREGASDALPALREHGLWLGSSATLAAGHDADRHPPELCAYDANGRRTDSVVCHPCFHLLMQGMVGRGLHSGPLVRPQAGSQVARAAFYLMQGQVDAGSLLPITTTFASLSILKDEPAGEVDFGGDWLAALSSVSYDPSDRPLADKRGALLGLGLSEKQGGSDLQRTATSAKPLAGTGRGRAYRLVGHKWFLPMPQADAHLVLAQTDDGLSCFFVPRWHPDATRNGVRIQRLKQTLGDRSCPVGEVEFCDAWGVMVGEPGQGASILRRAGEHATLDAVLGSAALLRQAVVQAMHYCRTRVAFGGPLIDQPLMRHVLADLALESEAATTLALRLALTFEQPEEPMGRAMRRIVTLAAKFWVCKRATIAIGECLEACGGNGYAQAGPMPRLLRDAPANALAYGASNVACLDLLRAMEEDQEGFALLLAELRNCVGINAHYDRALDEFLRLSLAADTAPFHGRRIAGLLAVLVQSSLLLRHAPLYVWEPFINARLGAPQWTMGDNLPAAAELPIGLALERAWPGVA